MTNTIASEPVINTATVEFYRYRTVNQNGEFSPWDTCPSSVTTEEEAEAWFATTPGYQLAQHITKTSTTTVTDENGLISRKTSMESEMKQLPPVFNIMK